MQGKKLAVYLRLSKETDGEMDESLSITNQRSIIETYLLHVPELLQMEKEEYIDDGYTGTNIKRPAFQKLLKDIQKEEISCIVVKDFSRFMRNHILQGKFLEELFPYIGIRFISVNDHYDSMKQENNFMLPIKGLTYEFYARDMAKKVQSIKQNQAKSGNLRVGSAPYGYKMNTTIETPYLIDKEAATIVRRIFSLALEGMQCTEIAKLLNDDKIPSPGTYKRLQGNNAATKGNVLWNAQSVRRILRNEVYLGTYVLNKRRSIGFGFKMRKRVPKDMWHLFPARHEAIITQEVFNKVQEIRNWRSETCKNNKISRLLACTIRCGSCNYALRKRNQNKEIYYYCRTPKLLSDCTCMRGYIKEKDIADALFLLFKLHRKLTEQAASALYPKQKDKKILKKSSRSTDRRTTNQLLIQKSHAYEQYKDGQISKEKYLELKSQYELENNQEEIQKPVTFPANFYCNPFSILDGMAAFNSMMVKQLVNEITVYHVTKIQLLLNYKDIFRCTLQEIS